MGSENVHEASSAKSETTVGVAVVGVGAGVLLFLVFLALADCGACINAKMTRTSTRMCLLEVDGSYDSQW